MLVTCLYDKRASELSQHSMLISIGVNPGVEGVATPDFGMGDQI